MSKRARLTRRRLVLAGILGGGTTLVGAGVVRRYQRDLARAQARLSAVDRRVISTTFGDLEYAEHGTGEPLLVVHGILHGCDGGLLSVRDLTADRRVIAPSRFGYLGSALPTGATPADQADAYVELLNRLGIDHIDVIGISAGTTSALQLALRHPDCVRHLVIMSGSWPGNPTAIAPPPSARFAYADVPMWVLKVFAPSVLARLMGVPPGFPRNEQQARVAAELADSIFPVGPRAKGACFDAFVSNPDVNGYPLEDLKVPTLVMHSRDDPLTSYAAVEQAAERIPEAVLVSFESGGHLGLGQEDLTRARLSAFLAPPTAV